MGDKRLKRKFIAVAASISLIFSGFNFVGGNEAHAESLKDKINSVKEKQSTNSSKQQEIKKEIEKIKHNQGLLDAEIKKLDKQVAETENKIAGKEKEIANTKEEIDKLKAEIAETKERIAERDEMLKDRVTAMYENGGSVQYLEVLLGSKSFGDFLDRVFALNEISKQDKEILEAHKADKKALEEMMAEVEQQLADLKEQMKELEALKSDLKAQAKLKNELLSELQKEEDHKHAEMGKLEDESDLLKKQQAAFEKEMKRQQAAKNSGSSSTPAVGNGMFMKPANAPQTSGFGSRWGELHAGIDLAKGGTVPIVASASGTVIKSYYSSSYGNVVFIAHYINGQKYTTVYAHMRNRLVGNGASVKKGQQIGNMGSTGRSTGQHLHFEIHKGDWNQSKSNAVNPNNYF